MEASAAAGAIMDSAEDVITAAIAAVDTMVGAVATTAGAGATTAGTTAGAAGIGANPAMDGGGDSDLVLDGRMGGDTSMDTTIALGGAIPTPTITHTIIRTIVRPAIRVLTTATTILRQRISPGQNPTLTVRRDLGDLPCREERRTRTVRQVTSQPLPRRVARFSPLTG